MLSNFRSDRQIRFMRCPLQLLEPTAEIRNGSYFVLTCQLKVIIWNMFTTYASFVSIVTEDDHLCLIVMQ